MASLNYSVGSAPVQEYTDIPAGDYAVIITESEMKETKNRNGEYLALKHVIFEGQHKDRVLFNNLNLNNPNAKAVQIAQGTLESICRAASLTGQISNSEQLHNKPMIVRVGYDETQDEGRRNNIKSYKAYVGSGTFTPPAPPVSVYTPPAVAVTDAPFEQPPVVAEDGSVVPKSPW